MLLTADKIHDGSGWLPPGSVIEIAEDGTIIAIENNPAAKAEHYEGILAPGFVNAHCHLELSHMKGVIPEHTGLIPFLKHIPLHRNDFTDEQKMAARHKAFEDVLANGTVAIGDISNTTDTLDLRAQDRIHFHTFVEALGFNDAGAPGNFAYALNASAAFSGQQKKAKVLRQSIVPHAPYSVSASLFRLIDAHDESSAIISIHNQESADEDLYYKSKQGRVPELLALFGIDDSAFAPSGKSSIRTYLEWMSHTHPFIFVHNTSTPREDVQYVHSKLKEVYWCLCPNANLYIENRLPDIDMLLGEQANICIGTDSLSSNHELSIMSELHSIKTRYPHIGWETLLTWATANGAAALQMQEVVGSFEVGKQPGILCINGIDEAGRKPTVKRII